MLRELALGVKTGVAGMAGKDEVRVETLEHLCGQAERAVPFAHTTCPIQASVSEDHLSSKT